MLNLGNIHEMFTTGKLINRTVQQQIFLANKQLKEKHWIFLEPNKIWTIQININLGTMHNIP